MTKARVARWMQWLLSVVAAFGLLYLFLVLIQPYRFPVTLSEKRGRVVDAQTGQGIADVVVVANYEMESVTPVQIGHGCVHQKIVRTDANGEYVIPDASRDIDVADRLLWRMLPGFSQSYGSILLYYKDGYAVKDDLDRMADLILKRPVPSVVRVSPYVKDGQMYRVPPVEMERVDPATSDVSAEAYIAQTGSLAAQVRCLQNEQATSEVLMLVLSEMKASVRRHICELPSDKVLAEEAKRFSFMDCASSIGMKRIRQKKGKDAVLTAGDVCESYRYVAEGHECRGPGAERPPLKIVTRFEAFSAKPAIN
ncbi:MAG TPA: hypothetical protein VMR06_01075 [Dokdonella sp.]|uniref:hypothetical protein n=1 Tax=Dokdonella sp. TaxID=2291710 RepID=UPI002C6E6FE3|nr:hypothetical protein [Dokdonella sp.]HUD40571.1 hypothetical protein [Dokdonella sp.]